MPWIWAIALLVASAVLSSLLIKKPAPTPPASLTDFNIPQIDENTPQPVVFGDCWTQGWFVLWYGNLRSVGIKPKSAKK